MRKYISKINNNLKNTINKIHNNQFNQINRYIFNKKKTNNYLNSHRY